jgi:hypothetical protein
MAMLTSRILSSGVNRSAIAPFLTGAAADAARQRAAPPFGSLMELTHQGFRGSAICEAHMNSLSAGNALLTIVIMGSAFLIEVGIFAWMGMF